MTIAGAHGLWLLPSILSLVGGSKQSPETYNADAGDKEPRKLSLKRSFGLVSLAQVSRIGAEEEA